MKAGALFLASALLLAGVPARAEQFVRAGAFEIHYNAFHADSVPAEVAAAHGLVRSGRRGMINVTVLEKPGEAPGRAVEATISGTITNLSGQRQPLEFRAVREAGALYYLADFPIAGEDLYRFALDVTPAGAPRAEALRFEQPLVAH